MARQHRGSWSRHERREFFVYLVMDASGEALYVGRSYRPEKRWRDHLRNQRATWTDRAVSFRKIGPFYYEQAKALEIALIEQHQPVGNLQHTARWVHPAVRLRSTIRAVA